MSLTAERTSPNTLVVTRRFAAPPARVYAAHTRADLLRRWMGGYPGWTMPVCEIDARPGGTARYRFETTDGSNAFEITATFVAAEPPRDGGAGRTVHLEVMHMPDPTPENHVETVFAPDGDGTLLTMTMRMEDPAALDQLVATGMTDGMEVSYAQLDALEREAA